MTKLNIPPRIIRIIDLLEQNGATDVLLVGGWVRDALLNIPSKDYDIEVYGLSFSKVREILAPHFRVDLVGKAFGVLKVGSDVDVALPRRESKNGLGHTGFNVESSPNLSPREAFARRDFTINAIGARRDGSFCDPFDGIGDLKRKLLKATSPAFKDDPLRALRGMQFAARFGFTADPLTLQYCREVLPEFSALSKERIYEEWKKWALKSARPDLGLKFLRDSGWVEAFPELNALIGCPQNPEWHPEGDVWTHTLMVCNEAVNAIKEYRPELSNDEKLCLTLAALAHDFGKPATTITDEKGVIRSPLHNVEGGSIARRFLENMRAPGFVVDTVEKLVREHMAILDRPSVRNVRRLANRLSPATIKIWALLRRSDALGCGSPNRQFLEIGETDKATGARGRQRIIYSTDYWLQMAEQARLVDSAPRPIVNGRDLIPFGIKPGPEMGQLLKLAFEAQLDDRFSTLEDGLALMQKEGWLNS